jgi:hypothetical protein
VSLSGKFFDCPSLDDTSGSISLGDSANVNVLVVLKDRANLNFLLEVISGPVNLLGDGSSVNLDFSDVSLLLSKVEEMNLSVSNNSDDCAVFLDSVKVSGDGVLLAVSFAPFLSILGESLFVLRVEPVLVESSKDLSAEVLSPDGGESSETSGSLDVSNNTDDLHGRALNDCNSLNNVLLDDLSVKSSLSVSHDVGHASLESHKSSQVDGL